MCRMMREFNGHHFAELQVSASVACRGAHCAPADIGTDIRRGGAPDDIKGANEK